MMKKMITLLAFACYLMFTTGVVINHHFCMKRLASTQIYGAKKTFCDKCGMHIKKSNGCCHDEEKIVKLKFDHNNFTPDNISIPALEELVSIVPVFDLNSFSLAIETNHFHNHSPPLLSAQDTYLQNRVFRI